MITVRRKPRQRNRMTAAYLDRVHIPDGFAVMLRAWMVRLVHPDGFWIMIDSNIHAVPCRHFYARTGPAASGEIIYYQLSVYHIPPLRHRPVAIKDVPSPTASRLQPHLQLRPGSLYFRFNLHHD